MKILLSLLAFLVLLLRVELFKMNLKVLQEGSLLNLILAFIRGFIYLMLLANTIIT